MISVRSSLQFCTVSPNSLHGDQTAGLSREESEPRQRISGEPWATLDGPRDMDHRSSTWTETETVASPFRDESAWGFVHQNSRHLHLNSEELRLLARGDEVTVRGIINTEYRHWVADRFGAVSVLARPEEGRTENVVANRTSSSLIRCSKKAQRKIDYARLQALYQKGPKVCARAIFEGEKGNADELTADDMTEYWAEVFGQPSKVDDRTVHSVCETDNRLARFVTIEEVEASLKGMNDGAPGPDNVTKEDLMKSPLLELTTHINLWLATGVPPDAFLEGNVVFVPKVKEPKDPGDYRPITFGTVIVRAFHRVLAKRLAGSWPLSERQKAFLQGDGLADNIWLLRAVIEYHKERAKGSV